MSTYGPRGHLVDAFLAEVSAAPRATWRALADLPRDSQAHLEATRAYVDAPVPVTVNASTNSAITAALRALAVKPDEVGGRLGRLRVTGSVTDAAHAIAAGTALEPRYVRVLLAPFDALGFTTVHAVLRDLDDA